MLKQQIISQNDVNNIIIYRQVVSSQMSFFNLFNKNDKPKTPQPSTQQHNNTQGWSQNQTYNNNNNLNNYNQGWLNNQPQPQPQQSANQYQYEVTNTNTNNMNTNTYGNNNGWDYGNNNNANQYVNVQGYQGYNAANYNQNQNQNQVYSNQPNYNNNGWSQPQPQSQPQMMQSHTQNIRHKIFPQQTQKPQYNQQQQIAFSNISQNISNQNITNNNKNIVNKSNIQNQYYNLQTNLYPTLPAMTNPHDQGDKNQITSNLGWIQEQNNVNGTGSTTFIQELGASKIIGLGGNKKLANTNTNTNTNQGFNQYNQQNYQQNVNIGNIIQQNFKINPIFHHILKQQQKFSPFIKYKIIPYLNEKKSLDVSGVNDDSKKIKKNSLIIWDYHGGPNQLFYIKKQRNGAYYIISMARGFAVQSPPSGSDKTQSVIARPRAGNQNELWAIEFSNQTKFQGYVQIINTASGMALDLMNERQSNGTTVIQWQITGKKNQMWRIVPF